jgi:hypothetical protein
VHRQFREWNHHLVAGAVVAAAPAARHESVKPPKQVLTTELHLGVVGLHKRLVLVEEAVEGAAHLHAKVVRVLAAGTTQQLRRSVTRSTTQGAGEKGYLAQLGVGQGHDVVVVSGQNLHGESET